MKPLEEGAATIKNETAMIVSKDLPVFYNPIMKHNRDITILLLKTMKRPLQCCDLLAGSGVRSIRLLKEAPDMIEHVTINDASAQAYDRIKENLTLNKLEHEEWSLQDFVSRSHKMDGPGGRTEHPLPKTITSCVDGAQLLLASNGYDYIDIDPFGSPNAFLDAAARRISREGVLAITATDTSALAASYPQACTRKYWATPAKGARKHEVGLRILIRKAQLVAAQYDKALEPILSYNKDHYYRIFFRARKGKSRVDELLARHGRWDDEPKAGPLWLGKLSNPRVLDEMIGSSADDEIREWLSVIKAESSLEQPGHFYHLNDLKRLSGRSFKKERLLTIKGVCGVHYEGNAIKTSLSQEQLMRAATHKSQG